jgi:opine dehydrogenase
MLEHPRFAVLGAGHGGQAMAGHLALMGFRVSLYNRGESRLEPIRLVGGISVSGVVSGFGTLDVVSHNIEEVLANADIIMVVVPATGHRDMAEAMAPYVQESQYVMLNPGRTGGALETHTILKKHGKGKVVVAEAQTLIYAARSTNPGQVNIFGIKNVIPVATIPSYRTPEFLKLLRVAYPQFVPGDNVLKTSMDNIGAIFHPALTILNAARIESTHGDFEFYMDGATPGVAQVLDSLDAERVAVAAALGIRAQTAREWLYTAYDAVGKTLYEAMQSNIGYKGITAPVSLTTRYLTEDVPMSLVPICSLGDLLGVPTPTMRTMIQLAEIIHQTNYWAVGRTADTMGLRGLDLRQIRRLVMEGVEE